MVEWIDATPHALGAPVTAENAIEVARGEIGPCYSRRVDDCLSYSDDVLRAHGLFDGCKRLNEARDAADVDAWKTLMGEVPYCEGYFAYERPEAPKGRTMGAAVVGVAVGMVLGIVLG